MFSSSSSTNPRAALQCPRGSRALPSEAIQRWHRSVYVSALLGTGPLSLSTDWRWDLEEKLLLLCLLYGSFFTLNAENLFRGHRIPASLHEPELIFAALGIDKAFSGAKYAGYVLPLSSLYFPPASLLGLVQAVSAGWRVGRGGSGNVNRTRARREREPSRRGVSAPLSVSGAANRTCDKR